MSAAKENPCRKFQANIFNKSKCQNCFKPRESHLLNDEDLTQVSAREMRPGFHLLGSFRKKLLLKRGERLGRLPAASAAAPCIRPSPSLFLSSSGLHWKPSANRFPPVSPKSLLPAAPPAPSLF
uniref:Myosin phosphatase Rho interacting protein n=1 Tax=Sus scrofa TaxID=9823 RepID=A0A8D1UD09_PIG